MPLVGEGRLTADESSSSRRLTASQAAQALDLTEGAVRGRIKRGTLRSHRKSGTVYVVLEGSPSAVHRDQSVGESTDQPELVEELRRTNELLRDVITTRDEEIRRRDTIIMNMTEAMKALNPPASEASEAGGSPESSGPVGELEELREELATERTRRERAESTLREGMDEERRRREEAERERDDLRREVFARREPRESPQTVEEEPERAEPHPDRVESPEAVQRSTGRSLWRRIFRVRG